jgi:hypothetical protein
MNLNENDFNSTLSNSIPPMMRQHPVDKEHLQRIEDLGIFSSLLLTFIGTLLLCLFFEFARKRLPNVYEALCQKNL